MTDAGSDLGALASRLESIADRLAEEGISDDDSVALAREAAELSARAGQEIDAALAELSDPGDTQPDGAE